MKWSKGFVGHTQLFYLTKNKVTMKDFKSLPDALYNLRERGYTSDFSIETHCLYCGDLDMRLNPDQFKVDEEYRFGLEGTKEETVLVAISTPTGVKGIALDSLVQGSGKSCSIM